MQWTRWRTVTPTAAWWLLAAGCGGETRAPARATAASGGVGDSVVFELTGAAAADSVVTVRGVGWGAPGTSRSESLLAVVTGRGRVALFDREGRHVRSVDRADAPPRPLGAVRAAASCTRGGLLVLTGDRRILALDSSGALATRWRVPASIGAPLGVQCETPDDVLMLADGEMPPIRTASLVRVGSVLYRFSERGMKVDTLGAFPGRELLRTSSADPGQVPPFGIFSRFAAGPTRVYLASSDQAAIEQLQVNGRALRSISFVSDDDTVSRSSIDSALRRHLAARAIVWPEEAFRGMAAALARNRRQSPWSAFAVDADENVWVETNEPPNEGARFWLVFGTDGMRLAKVRLPYDFEVTEVGRTYLLGYHRGQPAARAARRYALRLGP